MTTLVLLLKTFEKTLLYSKKKFKYTVSLDKPTNNGNGVLTIDKNIKNSKIYKCYK